MFREIGKIKLMVESKEKFAALLTRGIRRIFAETGKPMTILQDELGYRLGKQGRHIIEYYRKGNFPSDDSEKIRLAKELVWHGGIVGRKEFKEFLECMGLSYSEQITSEVFPESGREAKSNITSHLDEGPLYKRTRLHIEHNLAKSGRVTTVNQVAIQVTAAFLSSIEHGKVTTDSASKLKNFSHEFLPDHQYGQGSVLERILKSSEDHFLWLIEFTPPLLQGQTASYSYKQSYDDVHTMTYEALSKEMLSGLTTTNFCGWRFLVTVPTDELNMKFTFPSGYPISLPRCKVYLGWAEDSVETTRLIASDSFSATQDSTSGSWTLELLVQSARVGLTYALEWVPPFETSIRY